MCDTIAEPAAASTYFEDDLKRDSSGRDVVVHTCGELLAKLEDVRLSVLHLQYSLHAGDIGDAAVESSERAQKLWAWNQGGVFSEEVSKGVLEGALQNVFNAGFPDDGIAETEPEETFNQSPNGEPPGQEDTTATGPIDVSHIVLGAITADVDAITADADPIGGADTAPDCI
jgi:hypothetical protein